ncbi:MAG: hypothetical protein R8N23_04795 [Reichenbachiella sp.]|uniref:hypothetical protein n=1 Tax=Reichenbachiella sp. TaxID=2184521 RepID=UPI00296683A0|nr:hypothetical protein [Reichenbachiella sp.]MDW3209160.1 hypothetical protein [Reichenbachiella sp.]
MRRITGLFFLCLEISFLSYSQSTDTLSKIPTLNDHRFVSFEAMKSPYTNTSFFLELGLGESGIFTTDGVPVGDSTILNLNGELLFVNLRFGYTQKIKDWICFFVNLDYAGRIGNNAESIFISGVNTIITVEPGILFKIKQTKKLALSGYFKLTNTESSIVDVQQYLVDLINGKPYADLTRDVPALNGGGGMVASYAFGPSVALNMDGQVVYGETLERTDPSFQYYFGSNVSINFKKWINLPVSLIVGGYANTLTNIFSTEGDLTSSFTTKLAYTGSDSFVLAIESQSGRTPIEDTNTRVQLRGMSFAAKFYF